jgi:hypothetical protein
VLHPRPHQQPRITARGGRRRYGSAGVVVLEALLRVGVGGGVGGAAVSGGGQCW